MTNSILDVLTYMFDYIFESADYGSSSSEIDDASLKAHLSEAGFDNARIDKALLWLENIAAVQDGKTSPISASVNGGIRIYTDEEKSRLDAKARGFLLFLENMGQLNATQRETIIEQVLSLGDSNISLDDLKWVVMMVLGNSQDELSETEWLESVVFLDENPTLQ